jgi:hypothetical protein
MVKEKLESKKQQLEEEKVKDCFFRPQTSFVSSRIEGEKKVEQGNTDRFTELYETAKKTKEKIEKMQRPDPTFQPTIFTQNYHPQKYEVVHKVPAHNLPPNT